MFSITVNEIHLDPNLLIYSTGPTSSKLFLFLISLQPSIIVHVGPSQIMSSVSFFTVTFPSPSLSLTSPKRIPGSTNEQEGAILLQRVFKLTAHMKLAAIDAWVFLALSRWGIFGEKNGELQVCFRHVYLV